MCDEGKSKSGKDAELGEHLGELERECHEKSALAEERLTQLKYLQADFENLKKQFDRDRLNYIRQANEELITELLIVLDSIEKAVESAETAKDSKTAEGFRRIQQQFYQILVKNGLRRIDALGKKLDPYYHDAVLREENPNKEDNIVLEELQKGYMLNSKVIRHSKVKVSTGGGRKNG